MESLVQIIMESQSLPLNRFRLAISSAGPDDVTALWSRVKPDEERRSLLIYLLWVMRDCQGVISLMNEPEFPIDLLEEIILYARGRFLLRVVEDPACETFLLPPLSAHKAMAMILATEWIRKDVIIVAQLMANLDLKTVDQFVGQFETIEKAIEFFLSFFEQLREIGIRSLFLQNPDLCMYVIGLFEVMISVPRVAIFLEQHNAGIKRLRKLKDFVFLFNSLFKGNDNRDRRCAAIISEISNDSEELATLEALDRMGVFRDPIDKAIVKAFLTDSTLMQGFQLSGMDVRVVADTLPIKPCNTEFFGNYGPDMGAGIPT